MTRTDKEKESRLWAIAAGILWAKGKMEHGLPQEYTYPYIRKWLAKKIRKL